MDRLVSEPEFWQGRRVFLTGHTGFKGAWLALALSSWGAEVHGYSLSPQDRCLYRRAGLEDRLATSVYADLLERQSLEAALAASKAEVVIHMAAQALVRLSYREPVSTFATNVMGTVNLLEAVRSQATVRATLVVTSDKCYENREWVWGYREDEAMGGYDPYSSSKGCAELVASAYRQSFFTGAESALIASARAGNVIGGGDWAEDRLVPDLVRSFHAGTKTLIRNPDAVRPWQHVLEPLSGYLALLRRLISSNGARYAEGWNFGPDSDAERNVGDVVETACKLWGSGASWQRDTREHVHEAGFLKLDSSKARRLLAWKPHWSFDEAMRRTIDWYKADAAESDMAAFTLGQINDYFALRTASNRTAA